MPLGEQEATTVQQHTEEPHGFVETAKDAVATIGQITGLTAKPTLAEEERTEQPAPADAEAPASRPPAEPAATDDKSPKESNKVPAQPAPKAASSPVDAADERASITEVAQEAGARGKSAIVSAATTVAQVMGLAAKPEQPHPHASADGGEKEQKKPLSEMASEAASRTKDDISSSAAAAGQFTGLTTKPADDKQVAHSKAPTPNDDDPQRKQNSRQRRAAQRRADRTSDRVADKAENAAGRARDGASHAATTVGQIVGVTPKPKEGTRAEEAANQAHRDQLNARQLERRRAQRAARKQRQKEARAARKEGETMLNDKPSDRADNQNEKRSTRSRRRGATESATDAAHDAKEGAKRGAQRAGETIGEAAGTAKAALSDAAARTKAAASSAYASAANVANRTGEAIGAKDPEGLSSEAKQAGQETRRAVERGDAAAF